MSFAEVLDDLEKIAAESNRVNPGDYVKDGLLHCGKCNTQKQVRVNIFGRERKPFCPCKCEQAENEERARLKAVAELEKEYGRYKYYESPDDLALIEWLDHRDYTSSEILTEERKRLVLKICFGNKRTVENMSRMTFENDDGKNPVTADLKQYAENFDAEKANGMGRLLFGPTGTGKSYAAACVANALLNKGYLVHMTSFAEIRNVVQSNFDGRQQYYDRLASFDLLVLDDLGAESDSAYMKEIVQRVINDRYDSKMPVIITTNLTGAKLQNPGDMNEQRAFSRLYEMCIPLKVDGADRRRAKLQENIAQYKHAQG